MLHDNTQSFPYRRAAAGEEGGGGGAKVLIYPMIVTHQWQTQQASMKWKETKERNVQIALLFVAFS